MPPVRTHPVTRASRKRTESMGTPARGRGQAPKRCKQSTLANPPLARPHQEQPTLPPVSEDDNPPVSDDYPTMSTSANNMLELDYEISMDESKWKTVNSERRIGSLPDDQKCILYSLLGYEKNEIRWEDNEQWLLTLNDIRGTLFDAGSVSEADAKKDINELLKIELVKKKQKYLGIPSKRYAEDVMYQLWKSTKSKFRYNHSYMLTLLCDTLLKKYWQYVNGKKYIYCELYLYPFLVYRLQMDILTHPTMGDRRVQKAASWILNIPEEKLQSKKKRTDMYNDLRSKIDNGDVRELGAVSWTRMTTKHTVVDIVYELRPQCARSTIGLHDHNDIFIMQGYMYALKEIIEESTWPILLTILMSDGYQIKNNPDTIPRIVGRFLDISADQFTEALKQIRTKKDVFKVSGEQVTFASAAIRHAAMGRLVESCLQSVEDFEAYIEGSSTDSLKEYCRLWNYRRNEGERCVFIPHKLTDKYIKRLDIDVITHVMVEGRDDGDGIRRYFETRERISELFSIPLEVLSWDINRRKRYLKTIKLGKKKIYRARGMLVGCTGAGKTTLLWRLQRKATAQNQQPPDSTVGLEVHDNLFEIVSDTLKDHSESSPGLQSDKELISMVDFAGQAVYYACHQVYLSRRAFYLLLVDMSKDLQKEAHEDNPDRHNPIGSLFHHWTYQDYFTFWLQCIQTYCQTGERRIADKEKVDRQTRVIVIASHKDKAREKTNATRLAFFEKLKRSIPQKALKDLLSADRYFEVECPTSQSNEEQEEIIEKVRKCIVTTVRKPPWGEDIPISWSVFEDLLKEKKHEKLWRRSKLQEMKEMPSMTEEEIDDMLRFFHEIGQIIHFTDDNLRDVIIIDVQWFVDGFKNIITDENHLAREIEDCDEKIERGKIAASTLEDIWEKAGNKSYMEHKREIIPFMEKLGLMVEIKESEEFYIPSMNRIEISSDDFNIIKDGQKTSILLFHFKTYLPHFFFFRLVVHCFKEWNALRQDMFSKNAAFYKEKDHFIAIAINKTSIQLQIFTGSKEIHLQTERVREIRNKVDSIISELTKTFHRQVLYDIGYSCKDIKILDEDEGYFVAENEILPNNRQLCPRHPKGNGKHVLQTQYLLQFWKSESDT